jgi:predicted CXXCH cytochrome family protein
MRVRTAKQRAQRIDLNYFKHARGMKKWRILLSMALPVAAILWVSAFAAAGSRAPYSAGPVSSAHAFAEMRCEVCHTGAAATAGFRAHTTDTACLTCHDAPKHAANQTPEPACATCHQEHRGRVQLAKMDDGLCVECHGDLKTTQGAAKVATSVHGFPSGHPEFAALKSGAQDPGQLRFNHAVHLKDSLRGPTGPEKLECSTCHKPQLATSGVRAKGPATTGLMEPITFDQNCARCHPLFFDERVDQEAPHVSPDSVRAFVQQALVGYIRQNPGDINKPDSAFRRVPLNFPRPAEPPARNAQEWVARRAAADERILWNKTCAECHVREDAGAATPGAVPVYPKTNITARWMPKAGFDHTPHLMVKCQSCHAAEGSTKTSDVLMPNQAVCATCHTSAKGTLGQGTARAEGRCFECHQYHDWTQAKPVTPSYSLTDFK